MEISLQTRWIVGQIQDIMLYDVKKKGESGVYLPYHLIQKTASNDKAGMLIEPDHYSRKKLSNSWTFCSMDE